jgi:hypothetical protein
MRPPTRVRSDSLGAPAGPPFAKDYASSVRVASIGAGVPTA